MLSDQVKLVQDTFSQIVPIADKTAADFYSRLFVANPSLKLMFHSDMDQQGKKFITTLAMIVAGLHQPQTIAWAVQDLGHRHLDYGVQDEHYDLVQMALLGALAEALDDRFTDEVESAWKAAYELIAGLMQEKAIEA